MSAAIFRLPTAALQPVINPRKRGPHAKSSNVIGPRTLRLARLDRKFAARDDLERFRQIGHWSATVSLRETDLREARCRLDELVRGVVAQAESVR